MAQEGADAAYQYWQQQQQLPFQAVQFQSDVLSHVPQPYSTSGVNSGTATQILPSPGFLGYAGAGMGILGQAAKVATLKKGGLAAKALRSGLSAVPHQPAGLVAKRRGGLASVPKKRRSELSGLARAA